MKIYAPFTLEQVVALNRWQIRGNVHPFTCPTRAADGTAVDLVAEAEGWRCPACDYRQNWAHDFMVPPVTPPHRRLGRPKNDYERLLREFQDAHARMVVVEADLLLAREALDRARAVMLLALPALESDGTVDARRQVFELIQEEFDTVDADAVARAVRRQPQLIAALAEAN